MTLHTCVWGGSVTGAPHPAGHARGDSAPQVGGQCAKIVASSLPRDPRTHHRAPVKACVCARAQVGCMRRRSLGVRSAAGARGRPSGRAALQTRKTFRERWRQHGGLGAKGQAPLENRLGARAALCRMRRPRSALRRRSLSQLGHAPGNHPLPCARHIQLFGPLSGGQTPHAHDSGPSRAMGRQRRGGGRL